MLYMLRGKRGYKLLNTANISYFEIIDAKTLNFFNYNIQGLIGY